MTTPEEQNEEATAQAVKAEMFEVFRAGWLGAKVYDCYKDHKPILASNMLPKEPGIIEASFDAWLVSLLADVDVLGLSDDDEKENRP